MKINCFLLVVGWITAGASIPSEAMMHFPSVSDFPPIFKKFSDCQKRYFFPKNFLIFIRQNIWRPFLVISNFPPPVFPVSVHFSPFPPVSRKIIISPNSKKFPPPFKKNSPAFYILYVYFVSPHFDHDASMHHTMHALDASELLQWRKLNCFN